MIRNIKISNFALIDNITIDLEPNLNILTGETGSGKTILLDALAVALGSKADRLMVRNGAERAVMETKISGNTVRRLV